MRTKFGGFYLNQIGLHKFDDAITDGYRNQFNDSVMARRRRGERPAFNPIGLGDLRDLIGQLFVNSTFGLRFQFGLGDRCLMHPGAVIGSVAPRQVRHLIEQFPMRIGDVESLNQLQTRPSRWGFVHLVSFQASPVGHDNERGRCHAITMRGRDFPAIVVRFSNINTVIFFPLPLGQLDPAGNRTGVSGTIPGAPGLEFHHTT